MISKRALKVPIALFILGLIPVTFGVLFNLMEWTLGPLTGNYLIAVGTIVIVIALVILFLAVLFSSSKK